MTIEEYKKKLISVVENMEREHGCDIDFIQIGAYRSCEDASKTFEVEIDM